MADNVIFRPKPGIAGYESSAVVVDQQGTIYRKEPAVNMVLDSGVIPNSGVIPTSGAMVYLIDRFDDVSYYVT